MKKEFVEIKEIYNREGYLIKRTANDIPIFIPQQYAPMVKIITPDTEWIMQKKLMTRKQFELYQSNKQEHE